MACLNEIKRMMADLERVRHLAQLAAQIDQQCQVVYIDDGVYNFCREGESHTGKDIEIVMYF